MKKNTFSKILFIIAVIIAVAVNGLFFYSLIETKINSIHAQANPSPEDPIFGLQLATLIFVYIGYGSIANGLSAFIQLIGFIVSLIRGFKKSAFTWVQFFFIFVPIILEAVFIFLCQIINV